MCVEVFEVFACMLHASAYKSLRNGDVLVMHTIETEGFIVSHRTDVQNAL